jgi:hypothetical protein
MWIHFVSYKLGRLLLPFTLVLAAVSSFWLADPWRSPAVAAQACFYLVAVSDLVVPEGWGIKRLTSPARTFVVLMAAALLAVSVLFQPHRDLWREARA